MNLLVGLKQGCILNLVEFGCVGAEKKWGSVLVVVLWFLFFSGVFSSFLYTRGQGCIY